ncbi:metalloproteinase inhibitor 2-like [Nematolebias whitei]|uniref:metalloproteinase inhibitor 2-like n=1 Tax=Nematolebias whitei TaxID=451745 RepID=UPI00189BC65A|nr:metalloproteinase inhibitor 2-like [Nematolebias whitei]
MDPSRNIDAVCTSSSSVLCGATPDTDGGKQHFITVYACIKRHDGSCSWYRGCAPPKMD